MRPGTSQTLRIPAEGQPPRPLVIETDHANVLDGGTPNARLVAIRVPALSFAAEPGFKNG